MRDFRWFQCAIAACVCLRFTGAWADSALPNYYVENPYAPHKTDGNTARLGTAVGYIHFPSNLSSGQQSNDVLGLGLQAAIGHRFGRLSIESEYTYLGFQVLGPDDTRLGEGHRLGVIGRLEVLRLGSNVMGPNSMFAVYVEGGVATAWNHWYRPGYNEASRLVLDDTKRVEGQVGFGILLDHRLQEPIGFPRRVGWFLGWRVAMSPYEPATGTICRGTSCKSVTMMEDSKLVDRSLLFQSSLQFTF